MAVETGFAQVPTIKFEDGFVYLLGSPEGYYKIGKTKNLKDRVKLLSIQLPFRLALIHSIPSNAYSLAEKEMHSLFFSKRLHGEWFNLDKGDIDFIKSYDSMNYSYEFDL